MEAPEDLLRSSTLPQPLLSAAERVEDAPPAPAAKAHATASFAGSVFNLSAATLGAGPSSHRRGVGAKDDAPGGGGSSADTSTGVSSKVQAKPGETPETARVSAEVAVIASGHTPTHAPSCATQRS